MSKASDVAFFADRRWIFTRSRYLHLPMSHTEFASPPPEFVALVQGFLANAGHFMDPERLLGAVEVTVGESTIWLRSHPAYPAALLLELEACETSDLQESSPVWHLLHQMNAVAGVSGGWWIVAEEGSLVIARNEPISSTTPESLGTLILEGLERADALRAAIEAASRLDGPPADPGEAVEPHMLVQHA